MLYLMCLINQNPCPTADQVWQLPALMDPSALGVDPTDIATVIAWGFSVVLLGFLLGYGVGLALGLIKQA